MARCVWDRARTRTHSHARHSQVHALTCNSAWPAFAESDGTTARLKDGYTDRGSPSVSRASFRGGLPPSPPPSSESSPPESSCKLGGGGCGPELVRYVVGTSVTPAAPQRPPDCGSRSGCSRLAAATKRCVGYLQGTSAGNRGPAGQGSRLREPWGSTVAGTCRTVRACRCDRASEGSDKRKAGYASPPYVALSEPPMLRNTTTRSLLPTLQNMHWVLGSGGEPACKSARIWTQTHTGAKANMRPCPILTLVRTHSGDRHNEVRTFRSPSSNAMRRSCRGSASHASCEPDHSVNNQEVLGFVRCPPQHRPTGNNDRHTRTPNSARDTRRRTEPQAIIPPNAHANSPQQRTR